MPSISDERAGFGTLILFAVSLVELIATDEQFGGKSTVAAAAAAQQAVRHFVSIVVFRALTGDRAGERQLSYHVSYQNQRGLNRR